MHVRNTEFVSSGTCKETWVKHFPSFLALIKTLHWRHNDHDGVSNHQPHGCLLNGLFRGRSKKTSKLRVTGLCAGNSPGPVNSPHKGPVTRKMFPFDDVIMLSSSTWISVVFKYHFETQAYYADVTRAPWRLKATANRLFVQQLVETDTQNQNSTSQAIGERNPMITSQRVVRH